MSFLVNAGYNFDISKAVEPDGTIILGSAMPMHQLQRRKVQKKYPHMKTRYFDPQLYMSTLDAAESAEHCAKLATYPWFGVEGLPPYQSSELKQRDWMTVATEKIREIWPRSIPAAPSLLRAATSDCIDFQARFGCKAVILPAPLTSDPATDYNHELAWLDHALEHKDEYPDVPFFATIALSDICLRYSDPCNNALLAQILDSISAREIDGVYIVVEQGSEPPDGRHMSNVRTLWSVLHLVHLFATDCKLRVIVNFMGFWGLACVAAGAEAWASGWYKSLYRFRIADKLAGGRSFPSYWSYPAALDVHLESDFDVLNDEEVLDRIADETSASAGLLLAASRGVRISNSEVLPLWRYSQSNIGLAREHFLLSAVQADRLHGSCQGRERLDFVESWLRDAEEHAKSIRYVLSRNKSAGYSPKTKSSHVRAWLDAFTSFRRDQRL